MTFGGYADCSDALTPGYFWIDNPLLLPWELQIADPLPLITNRWQRVKALNQRFVSPLEGRIFERTTNEEYLEVIEGGFGGRRHDGRLRRQPSYQ